MLSSNPKAFRRLKQLLFTFSMRFEHSFRDFIFIHVVFAFD